MNALKENILQLEKFGVFAFNSPDQQHVEVISQGQEVNPETLKSIAKHFGIKNYHTKEWKIYTGISTGEPPERKYTIAYGEKSYCYPRN